MGYSPWGCKELDTTEATEHSRAREQDTDLVNDPGRIVLEDPRSRAEKASYLRRKDGKATGCTLGGQHPVGRSRAVGLTPPPAHPTSHEPLYEDGPGTPLRLLLWACSPAETSARGPLTPLGVETGLSVYPHSRCLVKPHANGVWRPALNWRLLKSGKAGATGLGRLL